MGIKTYVEEEECGFDSLGPGKGPMVGFSEHGNEP
jgi:hypothetical protein